MEAEVFDAHLLHEFEACVDFLFCDFYGIVALVPRKFLCAAAELVAALGAKSVPPCHGKLQPIFHFFAEDYLFGVIVAVSQRILAVFAFKLDFTYPGKILFCCHNFNVLDVY